MGNYYLAVDIGASSGRHILAELKNGRMELEEVYRFQNGMQERNGALCWDHEYLFREIKNGLKKCKELGKIPQSVSVDTWGRGFCASGSGRPRTGGHGWLSRQPDPGNDRKSGNHHFPGRALSEDRGALAAV